MDNKLMVLIIIVALFVLGGLYLISTQNNAKTTLNTTNNNLNTTNNSTNNQENESTQSQSNFISSSQAKSIAANYLASDPKNINLEAGNPSLEGGIYYVPMIIANEHSQGPKGTVVGYIKVDGKSGTVLGIQTWNIETNETIEHPP
jgi:hypothetical protein